MKSVFIMLLALLLSASAFGAVHSENSDIWYVKDFYKFSKHSSNLYQKNTKRSNSCGLTSLLLVNNYFTRRDQGFYPNFSSSVIKAKNAIDRLYDFLNLTNDSTTDTDDAKYIASQRWHWSVSKKANGNNDIDYNLDLAASQIKKDYPLLIAINGDFVRNPVKPFNHIVILFAYKRSNEDPGKDLFLWFDPYYGSVSGFYRYEAYDALEGNAPYLRAAP